MSNPAIDRGGLVRMLLEMAGRADVPVGRGAAPQPGGWTGQMMSSPYQDYAVIKAGASTSPAPGESERLSRYGTSWSITVTVTGHGETEERCDTAAYLVTDELLALDGDIELGGVSWTVQRVTLPRLGATEWSNQDKSWRVTYDVSLHLSRKQVR